MVIDGFLSKTQEQVMKLLEKVLINKKLEAAIIHSSN